MNTAIFPIKLYLQNQAAGQIWPEHRSLLIPAPAAPKSVSVCNAESSRWQLSGQFPPPPGLSTTLGCSVLWDEFGKYFEREIGFVLE